MAISHMAKVVIMAHYGTLWPVYQLLATLALLTLYVKHFPTGFTPHVSIMAVNGNNNGPFSTVASLAKPLKPL